MSSVECPFSNFSFVVIVFFFSCSNVMNSLVNSKLSFFVVLTGVSVVVASNFFLCFLVSGVLFSMYKDYFAKPKGDDK